MSSILKAKQTLRSVTPEAGHYFFGYYDKCPWDVSGKYMLALRAKFMDRSPEPDDEATIGLIDLHAGNRFLPLDTTQAWNWQQGCMLRWLSATEVIFNVRGKESFSSKILNVESGESRTLPLAVYAVSPDGINAVSLNFSRVHNNRPGYGYPGFEDINKNIDAPYDDGIFLMNLKTGEAKLIISIGSIVDSFCRDGKKTPHWFNHLEFSPDSKRLIFLHRWYESGKRITQFFSVNPDGSQLYCLADDGMTSHFCWLDNSRVLAWARKKEIGDRYFLFRDRTQDVEVIGEGLFHDDGHCSYSPDRKWILTDTYPDAVEGKRSLLLYNVGKRQLITLGRFYGPLPKELARRCDLHPRWSRDGNKICFDSIHEGSRKIYVMDISAIIQEGESCV
jgi:hypothetical protein